jgi:hypothetical protein
MAKYKEREVTAKKLDTNQQDDFIIYSEDYKGIKVKKSELTFTEEEKNELLKQDEEAYKLNKDSYIVYEKEVVPVEEPKAALAPRRAIVPTESTTVREVKAKAPVVPVTTPDKPPVDKPVTTKVSNWPFNK